MIGNNELVHHGIKGQKWGVRRYQNEDGTLTSAGKERYSDNEYVSRYSEKLGGYKRNKSLAGQGDRILEFDNGDTISVDNR